MASLCRVQKLYPHSSPQLGVLSMKARMKDLSRREQTYNYRDPTGDRRSIDLMSDGNGKFFLIGLYGRKNRHRFDKGKLIPTTSGPITRNGRGYIWNYIAFTRPALYALYVVLKRHFEPE